MKFKEILEIAYKCVPLFIVAAYCVGFFIFALYFIKNIGIAGKINLFTYLEEIDHLVIFGIGAVLLLSVFTSFISPSLIIYVAIENAKKKNKVAVTTEQPWRKLRKLMNIIRNIWRFLPALFICFPLGTPFLLIILLIISSFYPVILSLAPMVFGPLSFVLVGWLTLFLISLFLASIYRKDKNVLWGLPLVVFLFLMTLSPQSIINFAGYGNYWACLTITPSEGQSLIMNPEFKDLIRCSNDGFWYTPEQVFIPLQLRDHIFIARTEKKDNTKVEAIEVISKKEAHVFHVTPAPVSKSCDSSKEKTT